jgi:hypothetical protein
MHAVISAAVPTLMGATRATVILGIWEMASTAWILMSVGVMGSVGMEVIAKTVLVATPVHALLGMF